MKRHS